MNPDPQAITPAEAGVPRPAGSGADRAPTGALPPLTAADKDYLLRLSRDTLNRLVLRQEAPHVAEPALAPALTAARACFVTLTRLEVLRGCIGHLQPQSALWRGVMENTRLAAQFDPRFPPVAPAELPQLRIEISVLTDLRRLACESPAATLNRLCAGRDGVVLEQGGRRATFLPQVWEEIPDKAAFLERLCLKGGWLPEAWRDPAMMVSVYQVDAFHDSPSDAPGAGEAKPGLAEPTGSV